MCAMKEAKIPNTYLLAQTKCQSQQMYYLENFMQKFSGAASIDFLPHSPISNNAMKKC